MNLPKHIEERFDEEFRDCGGEYSNTTDAPTKMLKSFIAQMLEEEKERLVGEIEKAEISFIENEGCTGTIYVGWCCPKHKGFNVAKESIISLIKK